MAHIGRATGAAILIVTIATIVLVALGLWAIGPRLFENHDYTKCVNGSSQALQHEGDGNAGDTRSAIEDYCAKEFGKYIWSTTFP